jgi:hypothetical protein
MSWKEIILEPFEKMGLAIMSFLPYLVAGLIVLGVGYVVARLVRGAVRGVAVALGLERFSEMVGADRLFARGDVRYSFASFLGFLAFWITFLIFGLLSARTMKIYVLVDGIEAILRFVPDLLVSMVILGAAFFFGGVVAGLIRRSFEGRARNAQRIVARLAHLLVVLIGVGMALDQIGIGSELLDKSLLVLLVSVAFGVSLAFGLAVGLGAKEIVAQYLRHRVGGEKPSDDKEDL